MREMLRARRKELTVGELLVVGSVYMHRAMAWRFSISAHVALLRRERERGNHA